MDPTPLLNPKLVGCSLSALSLLDLPQSEVTHEEFVQYFSGNRIMPGSEPAAHCYCGHQFGHFAGQLGDGCAMYVRTYVRTCIGNSIYVVTSKYPQKVP